MKALIWFLSWMVVFSLAFFLALALGEDPNPALIVLLSVVALGAFLVGLFGAFDISAKRDATPEGRYKGSIVKLQAGLERQRQRRSDIEGNRYRRSTPVSHSRSSFVGWVAYRSEEDGKWLPGRLHLEGSDYYLVTKDLDPMDGLKGIELWDYDLEALHFGGSLTLDPGLVAPLIDDGQGYPAEVAVIRDEDGQPMMVESVS